MERWIAETLDCREGGIRSREVRGICKAGDVGIARAIQSQIKRAIVVGAADVSEIDQVRGIAREFGDKGIPVNFSAVVSYGVCDEVCEKFRGKSLAGHIDEAVLVGIREDFHAQSDVTEVATEISRVT